MEDRLAVMDTIYSSTAWGNTKPNMNESYQGFVSVNVASYIYPYSTYIYDHNNWQHLKEKLLYR